VLCAAEADAIWRDAVVALWRLPRPLPPRPSSQPAAASFAPSTTAGHRQTATRASPPLRVGLVGSSSGVALVAMDACETADDPAQQALERSSTSSGSGAALLAPTDGAAASADAATAATAAAAAAAAAWARMEKVKFGERSWRHVFLAFARKHRLPTTPHSNPQATLNFARVRRAATPTASARHTQGRSLALPSAHVFF
jgi:hypothetical protein